MGRLTLLRPRIVPAPMVRAALPEKVADSFYNSPEWKELRAACFRRDRFTCVAPGCSRAACVADHIVPRKLGGPDALGNLRSLCRPHDNQVKELPDGTRRNGGKLDPL